MFKALQRGQVSRVIPLIGTLNPVFLLLFASATGSITINETWAIVVLVFGLIFLTLPDWRGRITKSELLFEVLSAAFFSVSYILLHQAYQQDHFLTVFAWSRLILIPLGILLVLIPYSRKIVLAKNDSGFKLNSKMGALFLAGQAAGGASELLITFSVSLANPALVNSLQGVQYVFLFGMSLLLSRKFPKIYQEHVGRFGLVGKILGVSLIAVGLYILAFAEVKTNLTRGVTFSPRYTTELGLEPTELFPRMIDELNIRSVRLPVYWDEVEKTPGNYDFSSVDQYLNIAQQKGVKVILGLGVKQPRWPECFAPDWALELSPEARKQKVLELVRREVEHFGAYSNIQIWQVENEPYLDFGDCGVLRDEIRQTLPLEISTVKSIDQRPVMVTDTGELTTWVNGMKHADIFGISLYRTVWNPYFGLVDYPIAPIMYLMKAQAAQVLAGHPVQQKIISELQAEPWATGNRTLPQTPIDEQLQHFNAQTLSDNYRYATETGFNAVYLWGVEWWYFMDKNGHPEFIQTAKKIFAD